MTVEEAARSPVEANDLLLERLMRSHEWRQFKLYVKWRLERMAPPFWTAEDLRDAGVDRLRESRKWHTTCYADTAAVRASLIIATRHKAIEEARKWAAEKKAVASWVEKKRAERQCSDATFNLMSEEVRKEVLEHLRARLADGASPDGVDHILYMRFVEGIKAAEIKRRLGIKDSAASMRMSRRLKALAAVLSPVLDENCI